MAGKSITPITRNKGKFDRRGVKTIMKKERRKESRIIIKTIRESKKLLLELSDSVDPVSPANRSMKDMKVFLEQMQQEVSEDLQREIKENLAVKTAALLKTILLVPMKKLLQELWAKTVMVIGNILG